MLFNYGRTEMKTMKMMMLLIVIGMFPTTQALADGGPCSIKAIAGHWVFATGVGHSEVPVPQDITAIGTMNIAKDGSLSGTFDVTVQNTFFVPEILYAGSVTVNRDCRGTLTFITGIGTERIDSIVVVNRSEILGMSQDHLSLWTYQMRRISGKPKKADDD